MYKITVVDLDNGSTIVDTNSDCIIGAVSIPEKSSTQSIAAISTDERTVLAGLSALTDLAAHIADITRGGSH